MFSFDARIRNSQYGYVNMLINGGYVSGYNNFYDHDALMNFMVSQLLDVGDVITFINMWSNTINVCSDNPMTLVVYKI